MLVKHRYSEIIGNVVGEGSPVDYFVLGCSTDRSGDASSITVAIIVERYDQGSASKILTRSFWPDVFTNSE